MRLSRDGGRSELAGRVHAAPGRRAEDCDGHSDQDADDPGYERRQAVPARQMPTMNTMTAMERVSAVNSSPVDHSGPGWSTAYTTGGSATTWPHTTRAASTPSTGAEQLGDTVRHYACSGKDTEAPHGE